MSSSGSSSFGVTSSLVSPEADNPRTVPVPTKKGEWDAPDAVGNEALAAMTATFTQHRILPPVVPPHLVGDLRGVTWAWSTTDLLGPWDGYIGLGDRAEELFKACVDPAGDDFWFFGYRGHGMASYGMGMIARSGPILVSQQHIYGGAFASDDEHETVGRANVSWSTLFDGCRHLPGPVRYVVLFSDYRMQASIMTLADDPVLEGLYAGTPTGRTPNGWAYLDRDLLFALVDEPVWKEMDPELQQIVDHLANLMETDR